MLHLNRMTIACLCAAFIAGCGNPPPEDSLSEKLADVMEEAPAPPALDIVAPEAVATLDRNQLMSIMLIELPPGAEVPEHEAGLRAVYALTDGSLVLNSDDSGDVAALSTGDVDVWPAGRYGIENTGGEAVRFVVLNRTSDPLAMTAGDTTSDEAESPPESVTVLHQDQDFKIERVELMPESTVSMACENPCSIFTLTPATLVVESEGAEPDVMDVFGNRAVWFDGGSTWTVESDEDPVGLVVFELEN